jgi:hypothetical protein
MKKKKHKQSARHEVRAVHRKRRESAPKKNVESATIPWLRMVPSDIEDDPNVNTSRGPSPLRNGKRQPRDLDLYTPEHNLRRR